MNLLKELPGRERTLVRAKADDRLKTCLEVTRLLRDAGYIAEFDLGYREAAGFRWIVDLGSEGVIELTDQLSGKKWRKSSPAELLAQIMRGVSNSQQK